jgi:hypothetical protein
VWCHHQEWVYVGSGVGWFVLGMLDVGSGVGCFVLGLLDVGLGMDWILANLSIIVGYFGISDGRVYATTMFTIFLSTCLAKHHNEFLAYFDY